VACCAPTLSAKRFSTSWSSSRIGRTRTLIRRAAVTAGTPKRRTRPYCHSGGATGMRGYISVAATGGPSLAARQPSRRWQQWGSWSLRRWLLRRQTGPAQRNPPWAIYGLLLRGRAVRVAGERAPSARPWNRGPAVRVRHWPKAATLNRGAERGIAARHETQMLAERLETRGRLLESTGRSGL
jgi:hypothetical protein